MEHIKATILLVEDDSYLRETMVESLAMVYEYGDDAKSGHWMCSSPDSAPDT